MSPVATVVFPDPDAGAAMTAQARCRAPRLAAGLNRLSRAA